MCLEVERQQLDFRQDAFQNETHLISFDSFSGPSLYVTILRVMRHTASDLPRLAPVYANFSEGKPVYCHVPAMSTSPLSLDVCLHCRQVH